MAAIYIWPNIRALLIAGFSEEELRQFCFDTPDFNRLSSELAASDSRADIARKLLDYADRTKKTDLLLAWAAKTNLARFDEYQPYHSNASSAPLPLSADSKEIQQLEVELIQAKVLEQTEGEHPLTASPPAEVIPFPAGRSHLTRFRILLSITGVALLGGLGWIMILFVFLPTPLITSPVLTTTVVIASFVNCPDASAKVIQELEANYAELKPSLQIKNLTGVSNSQDARQQGKGSSADLVIWGECTPVNQLTMHLEILTVRGPDEVVELQSVTAQTSALDLDRANRVGWAIVNYLHGNYKDAADSLRILQGEVRSKQEQAELAFLQANSLLFAEKYQEAVEVYEVVLEYDSLKAQAYNNRGVAGVNWAMALGRSQPSQPYDEVLQTAKNDLTMAMSTPYTDLQALAYVNHSTAQYLFGGDYDQALADCQRAIDLASKQSLGYVCRAAVRYEILEYTYCNPPPDTLPVRDDLAIAESLKPNLPDIFYWRGALTSLQAMCEVGKQDAQIHQQEAKSNLRAFKELIEKQRVLLAIDRFMVETSAE